MTDKQTIIDGVNVSGCEFCDWKGSNIPQCRVRFASFEPICEDYNCYYKQLKRKEQENERLKSELQAKELELIMAKADLYRGCQYKNDYKAKEQECEELKEDEKSLLNVIDDLQKTKNKWEEKYNDLGQDFDQLKAENEKLKNKKEENETFYLKKYANRDSDCLELEHKLKQAKQKLEQIR